MIRLRQEKDGERRRSELDDLLRDLSRLGGALIAGVDTQGRPGLAWRGKHAAEHLGRLGAADQSRAARREAKRAAKDAKRSVG